MPNGPSPLDRTHSLLEVGPAVDRPGRIGADRLMGGIDPRCGTCFAQPSMLSRAGVDQHGCPIVRRDRTSRAMLMSPCHTDRHDKHGLASGLTKGHLFSVEMDSLRGNCSLIPGFRDVARASGEVVARGSPI